eukprot:6212758-Pleurochrysis_carterae.AAC.4
MAGFRALVDGQQASPALLSAPRPHAALCYPVDWLTVLQTREPSSAAIGFHTFLAGGTMLDRPFSPIPERRLLRSAVSSPPSPWYLLEGVPLSAPLAIKKLSPKLVHRIVDGWCGYMACFREQQPFLTPRPSSRFLCYAFFVLSNEWPRRTMPLTAAQQWLSPVLTPLGKLTRQGFDSTLVQCQCRRAQHFVSAAELRVTLKFNFKQSAIKELEFQLTGSALRPELLTLKFWRTAASLQKDFTTPMRVTCA